MTREKLTQEARETKLKFPHTRANFEWLDPNSRPTFLAKKVVSRNFSLFSRLRAAPVIKFLGTKYARVYYVCVLNAEKRIYESVIISMITNSKKKWRLFRNYFTLYRIPTRNFHRISNVYAFKCIRHRSGYCVIDSSDSRDIISN